MSSACTRFQIDVPAYLSINSLAQRSSTIKLNNVCAWFSRPAMCASILGADHRLVEPAAPADPLGRQ